MVSSTSKAAVLFVTLLVGVCLKAATVSESGGNVVIDVGNNDSLMLEQESVTSTSLTISGDVDGGPVIVSLTGDLVIVSKGKCAVQMQTITIPGDLEIRGGNGNDEVTGLNLAVNGNLNVNDRGGKNAYAFTRVATGRDMSVRTKHHDDSLALDTVDVGRNLRIDLGHGDNEVTLLDTAIKRDLQLRTGKDADVITMGDDDAGVTVDRRLILSASHGDNVIFLTSTEVKVNARVDARNGDSSVAFSDCTFSGRLFVHTSKSKRVGNEVTFLGGVFDRTDIKMGPGDSSVVSSGATFRGRARWLMKAQKKDECTVDSNGDTFRKTLDLSMSGSNDTIAIRNGEFDGDLKVDCGQGDDALTSGGNTFHASAEYDGGAGNDTYTDEGGDTPAADVVNFENP